MIFDTLIVPAREEGFQRVFLGEHKWYPIRLSAESRAYVKHLAIYRTAPISAVTHVAQVQGFTRLDNGRWAIELGEPQEVQPVKFISDRVTKTLQTPRLANLGSLLSAGSLNEILRK